MDFESCFSIWNKLTAAQKGIVTDSLMERTVKKGTVIHNGSLDCTGLLLIKSGQLRAYILSDEGREISIYRLFERDICLFSASCMMRSIQFEITIEAEKDTELWIIPPEVYSRLMKKAVPAAKRIKRHLYQTGAFFRTYHFDKEGNRREDVKNHYSDYFSRSKI